MARTKFVTEGIDEGQTSDTEVMDPNELPENSMAEMAVAAEELDSLADGADEAIDTANTLTETAGDLQEAVDSGEGINEPAAASLERMVNALSDKVGVWRSPYKVSKEGHKKPTSRVQATKEALDGLRERIRKIWESVQKYFWQAVEAVKNFFKGLFNTATRMKNRAEAVKKKATELKDKKFKEGAKVDAEGFGKILRDGNKLADVGEIEHFASENAKGDSSDSAQVDIGNISKLSELIKDAVTSVDEESKFDAALGKAMEHFTKRIATVDAKPTTNSKMQAPAGCTIYEQELPLGDVAFYATCPTTFTKAGLRPVMNSLKITIDKVGGYKDDVKFGEVEPLQLGKIEALAADISKMCAWLETKTKSVAEIEKIGKDLEAACKEAAKKGGEDKEKQKVVAENSPLAATAAKVCQNLATTVYSKYRSWQLTTAKGVLDYCSASLSQVEA